MKRKRIFRRFLTPVLVCCLLLTCAVVSVSADDSLLSDTFLDLSEYNDLSGSFSILASKDRTLSFDLPARQHVLYFEAVIAGGFSNLTKVQFLANGKAYDLQMSQIGSGFYRIFGTLTAYSVDSFSLKFFCNNDLLVYFYDLKVSNVFDHFYPEVGCLMAAPSDYQSDWVYMENANTPLNVYFDDSYSSGNSDWNTYNYPYWAYIGLPYWDKYDFMDVCFRVDSSGIESLSAEFNGIDITNRISFVDSSVPAINEENGTGNTINTIESWQWIIVRVDFRGLVRSSDSIPVIKVTGAYFGYQSKIQLSSVTGYVSTVSHNTNFFWWDKVTDFFSGLFGTNNDQQQIIDNANQSQEQINVTVNAEITNAVTDWNANVDTLAEGSGAAIAGSQISLLWLSSLADRIFNNMGWFGNIYFTCGFLAVFLLILSKSGIAGRVKSSFHSSNPKSTSGGSKGNNNSS